MTKKEINEVKMEVETLLPSYHFKMEIEDAYDKLGVYLKVVRIHSTPEGIDRWPIGEECAGAYLPFDDNKEYLPDEIELQINYDEWEPGYVVEDLYKSIRRLKDWELVD